MKRNNLFCTVLVACSLLVASCSQNDEIMERQDILEGSIHIMVADAGVQGDAETRAVTDAQYRTTFSDGDKMGIYAVKNGTVVADISNARLIYHTASGWSLDADQSITSLEYTKELAGATFYAYYPYQETITGFDASQVSPFDGVISAWTIGDGNSVDLSGEDYTKYDLMTGTSTPVKNQMGNDYTLSFSMTHALGMVVINLPPAKVYNFTNSEFTDEQRKYAIPVINPTFAVQYGVEAAKAVTPYSDGENYRILVKPEQCTVSGTFNDGAKTYSINDKTIAGGKYALYTIDKTNQTPIEQELSIGDYYCSDGSLIKASELQEGDKTNVIGVVYFVGNPQPSASNAEYADKDILKKEYSGCIHGAVLALDDASETASAFSSSEAIYGLNTDIEGYISAGLNETTVLGYNNTKLAQLMGESKGCEVFMSILSGYQALAPATSTGWYLPSIYEFWKITENYAAISGSMSSLGKSLSQYNIDTASKENTFYWSSSESGKYLQYISDLSTDNITMTSHKTAKGSSGSTKGKGVFRFALAF